MAKFTFTLLPWNQGFEITVIVEDPAGPIEESIVWEWPNISLEDLQYIKTDLLWRVEMVQMRRFDRDEYGACDAEFDHDWDRSVDDNDHQGDDIPF